MIAGADQFRQAAKQLADLTTIPMLLNNRSGAEKIRRAIAEFTQVTVAYVEQLEAQNVQLRAQAPASEQPPTVPPI